MSTKLNQHKFGPIQQAWLESLENHPERQTDSCLGYRTDTGYEACCLGELLIINNRVNGLPLSDLFSSESGVLHDGNHDETLCTSYKDVGLYNEDGGFVNAPIRYRNTPYTSLAAMNDDGVTWPDIAQFVRENSEEVFCKKV